MRAGDPPKGGSFGVMHAVTTAPLERWSPGPDDWDAAAVQHLFLRTGLGASPERAASALASGFETSHAQLIDEAAETAASDVSVAAHLGRADLLAASWFERLTRPATGCAGLRERMALVWHDHFATSIAKVGDAVLMARQIDLFRTHGLGDFRELLARVMRDPAMLVWLDGTRNRKGAPNENLARELFELFALGRGNYGEADVKEAARGLSGWRVDGRRARFRGRDHDDGIKEVLGVHGPLDTDGVVEATVTHPACPRFVARRLATAFVADDPGDHLVDALGVELVANDWDVLATVSTLLASRAFFAPSSRGARIASPVEFLCRAQLSLGAPTAPLDLASAAEAMGQVLYAPPSVEGWRPGRAWIGAASWIARERTSWRQAEDWSESDDSAELAPNALAHALLERLLPNAPSDWRDDYVASAERFDHPRAELCRALLAAPDFHLV